MLFWVTTIFWLNYNYLTPLKTAEVKVRPTSISGNIILDLKDPQKSTHISPVDSPVVVDFPLGKSMKSVHLCKKKGKSSKSKWSEKGSGPLHCPGKTCASSLDCQSIQIHGRWKNQPGPQGFLVERCVPLTIKKMLH